jgi:hypothetical protein
MSRTHVPAALRQEVVARAGGRCEYCRFPQACAFLAFEVEHIVAEKHGGATTPDNLALACPYCNRAKGTDLGSLDPETGRVVSFFHPRRQVWAEHFRLEGAWIVPLTAAGRVTVGVLRFNHPDRVLERRRWIEAGAFP